MTHSNDPDAKSLTAGELAAIRCIALEGAAQKTDDKEFISDMMQDDEVWEELIKVCSNLVETCTKDVPKELLSLKRCIDKANEQHLFAESEEEYFRYLETKDYP